MRPPRQSDEPTPARAPGPGRPTDAVGRTRCRSFAFLTYQQTRWTAFLITYGRPDGQWRGYFSFRAATGEAELAEVRTADLFVEESEQEVDARARGLGRPLLLALLESALDTHERRRGFSPDLQVWFRDMLARRSAERNGRLRAVRGEGAAFEAAPTLADLRARYDRYRLDQVAHMIGLMSSDDFREMVEARFEVKRLDFEASDRFQLAMSVVQDLEQRLPLPPFEVWVEDYLAHPTEYDRYAASLHGGGELP
jgi:hypothetical protein